MPLNMDGQPVSLTLTRRKAVSTTGVNIEKLKSKKKKRKRRGKEGKSPASSASAAGSPDSEGKMAHKTTSSTTNIEMKNGNNSNDFINESLRWPKYKYKYPQGNGPCEDKNLGQFPPESETPEEYDNRINVYKMNRRKRYLAAQQKITEIFSSTQIYGKNGEDAITRQSSSSSRKHSSCSGITVTSITVLPSSFSKSSSHSSIQEQNDTDNIFKSNVNHLKPILQQKSLSTTSIHTNESLSLIKSPNPFSLAVSMSNQNRVQEVV